MFVASTEVLEYMGVQIGGGLVNFLTGYLKMIITPVGSVSAMIRPIWPRTRLLTILFMLPSSRPLIYHNMERQQGTQETASGRNYISIQLTLQEHIILFLTGGLPRATKLRPPGPMASTFLCMVTRILSQASDLDQGTVPRARATAVERLGIIHGRRYAPMLRSP